MISMREYQTESSFPNVQFDDFLKCLQRFWAVGHKKEAVTVGF